MFLNIFQLTWKPPANTPPSEELLCFSADDDKGRSSETWCVTLAVNDVDDCDPSPCLNCGTCVDLLNDYRQVPIYFHEVILGSASFGALASFCRTTNEMQSHLQLAIFKLNIC